MFFMQTAILCLLFYNRSPELELLSGTHTDFTSEIDYFSMVSRIDFQVPMTISVFRIRFFNLLLNDLIFILIWIWYVGKQILSYKTVDHDLSIDNYSGYYLKGGDKVKILVNPIEQLTAVDLTEFWEIKRCFGRLFVVGNLSKRVQLFYDTILI
jgi:RNA 3'-terminal phosphate cyclase